MADEKSQDESAQEPLGFTSHTRSLASEYAHEQGWGLNEAERIKQPEHKQDFEGGKDYDYGAQDFGDTATDTSTIQPSPEALDFMQESPTKGDEPDVTDPSPS